MLDSPDPCNMHVPFLTRPTRRKHSVWVLNTSLTLIWWGAGLMVHKGVCVCVFFVPMFTGLGLLTLAAHGCHLRSFIKYRCLDPIPGDPTERLWVRPGYWDFRCSRVTLMYGQGCTLPLSNFPSTFSTCLKQKPGQDLPLDVSHYDS